ncbi:MAG: L,D-transpeptidase family protein [Bacteroidales bacterium]|nr:L,D-transpeptidase family protein [Bacteroidales bacterium]
MKYVLLLVLFLFYSFLPAQTSFLQKQKQYSRVRTAIKEKDSLIKANLKINNIKINELNILILVFKAEDKLEIFAKKKTDTNYNKIKTYSICAKSGILGPKRKQGDLQVPEGFYYINRFNPYSSFYLSLGLNYPNASDKRKSNAKDLGGDIFIHGDCVTIGCMPMTNDKIKEIYLYAVYAKNSGQNKIPVYIFPFKMNDENFKIYTEQYKNDKALIAFWTNLKSGYNQFEKTYRELKFVVDANGNYQF